MLRNKDLIHCLKGLQYFFALMLGHKDMTLLVFKPIIIVQNYHELITEHFGFIKHSDMSDMNRVKPPAYSDNRFLLFCFHGCIRMTTVFRVEVLSALFCHYC